MMKINRLFFAALASTILFASCDNNDSDDKPLGSYDDGILVLNEGGEGTVTYINDDLTTVQQDIFTVVNPSNEGLGMFAQSIFFDGDRAYIISSGSNKITVANRYTFEYIGSITTGLAQPRYGVAYDGMAYVTNSSTFESNTDDYVSVINLATLAVQTTIPVNTIAEKIIEANGKIYVCGGAFGSGDKITVINTSSKTVETAINVGVSPNSLEENDGILYVLCGSFDDNSKLVRIQLSNNTILNQLTFPASMDSASNLDVEDDKVYFMVGPKVYKFDVDATAITDAPLLNTQSTAYYIGYGFGVKDDRIYISEAASDFQSDGKIFVYSTSGAIEATIPVGLGPNGFYFN